MPEPDRGIDLQHVCVDLDGHRVLDDVSVSLTARTVAVIGANGSGKSTFTRLLNGLVTPTSGSVRVHGLDAKKARDRVGFVFSSPEAQLLMPTVAEDVALTLRRSGLSRSEIRERVTAALMPYGLAGLEATSVHALSSGQKQLLAFASVLVGGPALLVADEPTTLLDRGNARRIGDLLIEELPMQAVIVTHDLDLAARCEVAILFDAGRIRQIGRAGMVVDQYREMYA